MWDCHWQAPADYGLRYDIGCFTISPNEIADFRKLLRRRPREWWAYNPRGAGAPDKLAEPVTFMDGRAWAEACRKMGGIGLAGRLDLTRGTAAAMAALEWLRPATLRMIGFDTVAAGVIAEKEYGAAAAASNAARKVTPQHNIDRAKGKTVSHDYPAERRLIEAAAIEFGAQVFWGF